MGIVVLVGVAVGVNVPVAVGMEAPVGGDQRAGSLGHEKVDTTLGYARLYDGTISQAQRETLQSLRAGILSLTVGEQIKV